MDNQFSLDELAAFIVQAKAATYIGDGQKSPASRPASIDLQFKSGQFAYLDSYFGGANFIGEEVVYYDDSPVWGMNYFGYLLKPELITAPEIGQILKTSLSKMYREGRFLGGFRNQVDDKIVYIDTSQGQVDNFTGKEWIELKGICVYELHYHGGLIKF